VNASIGRLRFVTTVAACLGLATLALGCAQSAVEGTVTTTINALADRDGRAACAALSDEAKRDLTRFRRIPTTCEAVVGSLDPATVEACRRATVKEVKALSSEEAWARVRGPRGDKQIWLTKLLDRDWRLRTPPCGPGTP
jgi:hypothetical protein